MSSPDHETETTPTHTALTGRSAEKNRAIVAAAEDLFLTKGFEAVSMDEIAERAGVSKRTVYSHFGSKEDMFVALLESKCGAVRENVVEAADNEAPIDETLVCFGIAFLAMIFNEESLKLFRILAAQSYNFPDLGRRFYEAGPERSTEAMATYLKGQAERGVIRVSDPKLAAGTLVSSMLNKRLTACLLQAAPIPDAAEREALARNAVSTFLDGVRAG